MQEFLSQNPSREYSGSLKQYIEKISIPAKRQWLLPAILATKEAEIRRFLV
jgi:hypothetical protein